MTPLEFLGAVYQTPDADPRLRVTAATAAARYTHAVPGKDSAAGQEGQEKIIEGEPCHLSPPFTDADAELKRVMDHINHGTPDLTPEEWAEWRHPELGPARRENRRRLEAKSDAECEAELRELKELGLE
jgi:hypothetical protein